MLPSSYGLSLPSKYQLQVSRMRALGLLDLEFTQSGYGPWLIDRACQQNVRSLLPTTQQPKGNRPLGLQSMGRVKHFLSHPPFPYSQNVFWLGFGIEETPCTLHFSTMSVGQTTLLLSPITLSLSDTAGVLKSCQNFKRACRLGMH
jgi:hypothetical protein